MNNELKRELEEIKSPLAGMDKHYFANQNEVPANYFEGMEDRFFQLLREKETPREARQISMFSTKRFSYAVAAVSAFAILSLGILTIMKSSGPQLSENDVKTYLEEEGDFLAVEMPTKAEQAKKIKKLSDDEIKNYLCEVEGMDCGQIN
jgi:hypothetical protein